MDADFPGNAHRALNRGRRRSDNQDFQRTRAALSEDRTRLERPAPELEVSRVSIGARRGIDRIFRRSRLCQLADRFAVLCHYGSDCCFAPLRRRALLV